MDTNQKKIISYYNNLESRLGYTFLTWNTKHFGYYPSKKRDINEKEAQRLMIELLAKKLQLNQSSMVLDAGCGRGTTTCYLAEKYRAKIIGIDIVAFELKIATKLAEKLNLTKKVKFYLKDYSKTGFPKEHFDKIFTLETLVHSPYLDTTLKEFNRILKPKGRLVLFEYSRSRPEKFTDWQLKMFKLINNYSVMTSLNMMYHETLTQDIEKEGFKILSDEDISEHILPSLNRFSHYAKIPYQIIKFFNLQKYFINATAAIEFYEFVKKGLVKYRVIVVEKNN